MTTYLFYIDDTRYSVQQLLAFDVGTDKDALDLAKKHVLSSQYYLAIDVICGDRDVGRVER